MQPRNMSMSGVVDLAALKAASEAKAKAEQARAQRQDAGTAPAASPLVIEVTEATFESDVLQRSAEVPVVISFWADQAEQSKQLNAVLERLTGEYRGRFVLATAEVYANQTLFQQFGVQGVPAVFAVLAGQAMPLFQGAAPEDQITEVLDQLISVAEERFGIIGPEVDPGEAAQAQAAPPPRPATPQELALSAAHEALDAGDLGGAIQAYKNVLSDEPANVEAKLGLAQAELLRRVQGADPKAVREAAANAPGDVAAQLAAADLELVGGHVEDAFGRLVDAVRRTAGEDRETVRLRLLELFEVIGPDDPRVVTARTALARVLF
ncbi:tetratricopeptide repeat protein [Streptomyces sp. NBC_01476]|uniref:tetratricopeptide repeat protein n=1 Tax=Streptomyces sp. NBC_01476 TaxID=2903881 RepID=UPI002E3698FD|nr:tetratricopeptide repeat protein [Streptomyces sp. NBC_01476]